MSEDDKFGAYVRGTKGEIKYSDETLAKAIYMLTMIIPVYDDRKMRELKAVQDMLTESGLLK